jgi:putative transposase
MKRDVKELQVQKSNKLGSNMRRHIVDASWGQLVQYLLYKAEYAGRDLVQVDPRNTSRMCSGCSNIKEDITLSDRIYHCDSCNLTIDRDFTLH